MQKEPLKVILRDGREVSENFLESNNDLLFFRNSVGPLPEDNVKQRKVALFILLSLITLPFIYSLLVYFNQIPHISFKNEESGFIGKFIAGPEFVYFVIFIVGILFRYFRKRIIDDSPKFYFDKEIEKFGKLKGVYREEALTMNFSEISELVLERVIEKKIISRHDRLPAQKSKNIYNNSFRNSMVGSDQEEVKYLVLILKNGKSYKIMSTLSEENAIEEGKKLSIEIGTPFRYKE